MNYEGNGKAPVNKLQAAFIVLFFIIALINMVSISYDSKSYAEQGSYRILLMSAMTVVSVIAAIAVFVLYFLKISRMRSIKVRYFAVSLCCAFICAAVVFRGFPYIQDLKEGTSVVVTNDYWYYMGSEVIEFTDSSGNRQAVSAGNLGETVIPLIESQFFSAPSDKSGNNKKSIYIEYYPHSRTVADIHMVK